MDALVSTVSSDIPEAAALLERSTFSSIPRQQQKYMHRTGLEPVPEASPSMVRWEASILPLNYRCFSYDEETIV